MEPLTASKDFKKEVGITFSANKIGLIALIALVAVFLGVGYVFASKSGSNAQKIPSEQGLDYKMLNTSSQQSGEVQASGMYGPASPSKGASAAAQQNKITLPTATIAPTQNPTPTTTPVPTTAPTSAPTSTPEPTAVPSPTPTITPTSSPSPTG